MKKRIPEIVLAIAALAPLVPQTTQAAVITDLQTAYFQPVSGDVSAGTNNWWYRISPSGAYSTVNSDYTMWSNGASFDSGGTGLGITGAGNMYGSPGETNWVNLRYVPVVGETVNISGFFQKTGVGGGGGDGISVFIRNNNGADLFSQVIGNTDTGVYNFNFNTTVVSGDKLDFLISPNAANNWWDNFTLGVTISQVPEPSSLALVALGGVALFARRRREG